jgi:hypothetical protein
VADSIAVLLGRTLVDLIRRRKPTLPRAKWETNYREPFSISESPNKQATSNACELVWALNEGKLEIVDQVLAWFAWLRTQPFTPKECIVPEEAYRSLTAYPTLVAAGVAHQRNNLAAKIACLDLARAHLAWCLLGIAMRPGRSVKDHHLDHPDVPCVLIGTGSPNYPERKVTQCGDRGWIRSRTKGSPKVFLFTDHIGLSVIVYQGLGLKLSRKTRKACSDQVETLAAILDRWPSTPVWGLSAVDAVMAKRFFDEPTRVDYAREIVPWLLAPERTLRFVRFNDGTVIAMMEDTDPSSTDWLMIDASYSGGETRMTSADDGNRDETLMQIGMEETSAFACQRRDGAGPVMRLPKPNAGVAYRVFCRDRVVKLETGASEPLVQTPPPKVPPPPKGRRWWEFWK